MFTNVLFPYCRSYVQHAGPLLLRSKEVCESRTPRRQKEIPLLSCPAVWSSFGRTRRSAGVSGFLPGLPAQVRSLRCDIGGRSDSFLLFDSVIGPVPHWLPGRGGACWQSVERCGGLYPRASPG